MPFRIKMSMISIGQLQLCAATKAGARNEDSWKEEERKSSILFKLSLDRKSNTKASMRPFQVLNPGYHMCMKP